MNSDAYGEGGSGTALVIRYLKKNVKTPILAVDADPNTNLGESLDKSADYQPGTG